jgi:hypothetical protein
MSNDEAPTVTADEHGDGIPSLQSVASRAGGRPPEEQTSDDPAEQAEVILEESEDRVLAGAEGSKPTKKP